MPRVMDLEAENTEFRAEIRQLQNQFSRIGGYPMVSTGMRLVETTAEHQRNETRTCNVLSGAKGSESTTGSSIDCYNRFSDLAANTRCIAAFVDTGWELIAALCQEEEA